MPVVHRFLGAGIERAKIFDAIDMDVFNNDSIEFAINRAITHLRMAIPDPTLWSGATATSCANAIEALVAELLSLGNRIDNWAI